MADTNGDSFTVQINVQFVPVRSFSGGKPGIAGSSGSETCGPDGHSSVSELAITAYVTPNQRIPAEAAHRIAHGGQHERFTITGTEDTQGTSAARVLVGNCLLTSLDLPTLSADAEEVLCETATFQPEIREVSSAPTPVESTTWSSVKRLTR